MQTELNTTGNDEVVTYFADVILPVPIPKLFTYRVPLAMNEVIQVGARVIVQFGSKKVLTAVVAHLHKNPPANYKAKYLLELLDDVPMVTPKQIEMFQWMAGYYMCYIGEVLNVALPSGLKISSQSKIQINPNADLAHADLAHNEQRLIEALQEAQSLSYTEAGEILGVRNIYQLIKALVAKDVILVFEEIKERYQPKRLKKIRLCKEFIEKQTLDTLSKSLEKKPKQQDVLLNYLRHVPVYKDWMLNDDGLAKSAFTKNETLSNSALKTLMKNGIFEEFEIIVSRFDEYEPDPKIKIELSERQQEVSGEIMLNFEEKNVVLLHGVTGSGKTEIYIDLIQKVFESGSQVLFLLPEIALTTQIVSRLKRIFGNEMGVYHSKFSDNERVEVWQGVVSGRFNFVVGVRSAVFLPFDNLGLIIVDEEHESSYKQYDPAPRYHARDMTLVIARQQHCKVLLGSATPSTESFYNAKIGRYGLVQLKERYGSARLPDIQLVDLTAERKKMKKRSIRFSATLIQAIRDRLHVQEQVILFQNRRGYSPYMSCRACAHIPKCENCAVSLTYHMYSNELRCHYCGHIEAPPRKCPACGSMEMATVGYGTEKIEDELKVMFTQARVHRMDLDTTRAKNSYQQIIQDFENQKIEILVGTQMLSKGLDFDNVSLVGIFDADRIINFPDFRSHERAFQIMTQVSGRAGRKDKPGLVLIQTSDTHQDVLHKIIHGDYEGMYRKEIEDRQYFKYPPFTRLIKLTTKHIDKGASARAAQMLADGLTTKLGRDRVLGPEAPLVEKIRNKYLKTILIKLEREKIDLKAVKNFIQEQREEVLLSKEFKKLQIVIDVDPV